MDLQVTSWHAEDVENEENDNKKEYVIKAFGRNAEGKTVGVTITNFQPFFYVKINPEWENNAAMTKIYRHLKEDEVNVDLVHRKDFWGFTNKKMFSFFKVEFKNHQHMKQKIIKLGKVQNIHGLGKHTFQLYESNIEPFLRFIHMRKIMPSGWIRVGKYIEGCSMLESISDIDIQCDWKQVAPIEDVSSTAPFLICSFDLECTSSGGEFPVPRKTYKHFSSQIYDIYTLLEDEGKSEYTQKQTIIQCIMYALGFEATCSYLISKVQTKMKLDEKKTLDKLLLGIDDIYAIIRSKGKTYTKDRKIDMLSTFFEQASWMGPLKGDAIIQIGSTFHRYGMKECFYKHILTLGSCDPIEGVDVECFDNEKDLIMAWKILVQRMNPDIITGYNIFGFDFDYIYNRAIELGIEKQFMQLSRLKNVTCKFKEQLLASSALGSNIMKYIVMEGRVLIDLMKVVQRDHKLDSYKLDSVAFHFTGEKKNDVSPKEIFSLQEGSSADRKRIAEYCVQDCALCNRLIVKLEILANNMGMSNVCLVPLEYIFMRGQGIKIYSLVMNECRKEKYLIPVLRRSVSVRKETVDDVAGSIYADNIKQADAFKNNISIIEKAMRKETCFEGVSYGNTASAIMTCAANMVDSSTENIVQVKLKSVFPYMSPKITSELSAIVKEILESGEGEETEDSYEGAIVLPPKQGIYIDKAVSVFDYASLYPSSMISGNLSHDMMVIDPQYDNLPGVEYNDITYDIYRPGTKEVLSKRVCRFVQGEHGIIPRILMKLLSARKATRKKMTMQKYGDFVGFFKHGILENPETGESIKVEDKGLLEPAFDEFQLAVMDGLQVAYKVTANSLYGQIGARTSQIYLKDIAACTTATGRNMILLAKDFLEKNYLAEVIYGDSVTGDTPLVLKMPDNTIEIRPISQLADIWFKYKDEKEQGKINAMVWTQGKWAPILRVIRHKSNKTLYRVNTNQGCVDVTEDHSIIDIDGNQIKPTACTPLVTKIMHSFPTASAGVQVPLNAYDVMCYGKTFVENGKSIPKTILNGTVEVKKAFIQGYTNGKTDMIKCESKLIAQGVYFMMITSGYTKLKIRPEGDTYWIENFHTDDNTLDDVVSVKKLSSTEDYVYDLETTEGIFQGGVGSIVCKNTDSIFCVFPKVQETGHDSIMPSIEISQKASNDIKPLLKQPHDLEYEKTFWPFVLLSKKRYVGNLYEKDDVHFKQKSMGIVLKRRDNANIVKQLYGGVIDIILNNQDLIKSIEFLNDGLQKMIDGEFPIESLIISKSLAANYKDPKKIAHKVLADRIAERDPGNKPQINDRIPYIYIKSDEGGGSAAALQGERIETPDFVKQNNLVPDYGFYITNQIMKPLLQLYALEVEKIPGFEKYPSDLLEKVKKNLETELKDKQKVDDKFDEIKEVVVKELLFNPILSKIENHKLRKSLLINKYYGKKK